MRKISFISLILMAISFGISCNNKPANLKGNQSERTVLVENLEKKQLLTAYDAVDYEYSISIPSNYTINKHGGEDFVIYYIDPIDTAAQSPFSGGIYFGNHPSLFEYCENGNAETIVKNTIFGKSTKWTIYNCDKKYSIQAIVKSGSKEHWCEYMHVFGSAVSKPELEKLFEVFGTLSKSKIREQKEP